mmetsp:Transcript_39317/g.53326  ORF Transcript_39317/g.53326 Transcript_39317/m.53326 type:complete len:655 (-) Transcript_39317:397-2361(-)
MWNTSLLVVLCTLNYKFVVGSDECGDDGDDGGGFSIENPVAAYLVMLILIIFSGLFSGLTLGLLGLDKINLQIIKGGNDNRQSELASKIIPVREKGNLLLCSLLLGNVGVNALLSIIMADYAGGIMGFILSTVFIVIFGEIIPQATCSRYALEIGSATIPIVKVIMFVLYPMTKPLAMILDKVLGDEIGSIHSTGELIEMIKIHEKHDAVDNMQNKAITGALKFKDLNVLDIMTPVEDVYMINEEDRLDFKKLSEIFQTGFSRIPIYGKDGRDDIVGMIFVKDLIFIVPEDETPVKNFFKIMSRQPMLIEEDDAVGGVLIQFKSGNGHMAIVRGVDNSDETRDPVRVVRGILTLEDIVEELIGEEIVDETDVYIDVDNHVKVQRVQFDPNKLKLLTSYKSEHEFLGADEVGAISSHLISNVSQFKKAVDEKLLSVDTVKAILESKPVRTMTKQMAVDGEDLSVENSLYTRDTPTQDFTLILDGQVTILAGKECFQSTLGRMSVLAPGSLWEENFAPDYTAVIASDSLRYIQISRAEFIWHVKPIAQKKKRKARRAKNRQNSTKDEMNGEMNVLPLEAGGRVKTQVPTYVRPGNKRRTVEYSSMNDDSNLDDSAVEDSGVDDNGPTGRTSNGGNIRGDQYFDETVFLDDSENELV